MYIKQTFKKILIIISLCLFILLCNNVNIYSKEQTAFEEISDVKKVINNNEAYLNVKVEDKEQKVYIDYDYYYISLFDVEYVADSYIDNRQDTIVILQIKINKIFNSNILEVFFVLQEYNQGYKIKVELSSRELVALNLVRNDEYVLALLTSTEDKIFNYLERYNTSTELPQISTYGRDLVFEGGDGFGGGTGGGTNTPPTLEQKYPLTSTSVAHQIASKDTELDKYSPTAGTQYTSNQKYKDDDIIKLIPKSYFFNVGKHTVIGEEYGYLVWTVKQKTGLYHCKVFVYDIEILPVGTPNFNETTMQLIPKFSYMYRSVSSTCNDYSGIWNSQVATGYEEIVLPMYQINNIYIRNTVFRWAIKNNNAPNSGDSNYNMIEDYGDYVSQIHCTYNGTEVTEVSNTSNGSLIFKTVLFTLGFIPYTKNFEQVFSKITAGISLFESYLTLFNTTSIALEHRQPNCFQYNLEESYNNYVSMGGYPRCVSFFPTQLTQKKYLSGISNNQDCITTALTVNRSGIGNTYLESTMAYGVSIEFVQFNGGRSDQITSLCKSESTIKTITYQRG